MNFENIEVKSSTTYFSLASSRIENAFFAIELNSIDGDESELILPIADVAISSDVFVFIRDDLLHN